LLTYFIIGSIGGFLSGLLGIGGGVVFVPLLTYFTKIDFKTNTGISSLAVVFVATASSLTYIFKGFEPSYNIILIIFGGIVGGYFGGKWTNQINTITLKRVFSLLLLFVSYKMIFGSSLESSGYDSFLFFFLIGIVSGVPSGLLGIGGGIIRIPLLIFFGSYTNIVAQGISLITTIPTALTAAITKMKNNKNLLKIGLSVGIFGVIGSIFGSNVAFAINSNYLNIGFGAFLFLVSLNMLFSNKKS